MIKHRNTQQGISMVSMAVVVVVILFFAVLGFKLAPIYVENYSVSAALKSLKHEIRTGDRAGDIRDNLLRRLQVNDVESVKRENIHIKREVDGTQVVVEYEVRKPFFGNVDLVVYFSETETM